MKPKKNPELEIGRNSSLYFALGLNIMLLISWQALEYKTYDKSLASIDILDVEQEIEEEIPIIHFNTPPPPPPPAVVSESIEIVEDLEDVEETVIESTETNQDDAIQEIVSVEDVNVEEVDEDIEVPFAVIENVPVFPGCEGLSKKATKDCFQKKMQDHVVKIFSIQKWL